MEAQRRLAQIPVCGANHAKGSSRLCLHTSSEVLCSSLPPEAAPCLWMKPCRKFYPPSFYGSYVYCRGLREKVKLLLSLRALKEYEDRYQPPLESSLAQDEKNKHATTLMITALPTLIKLSPQPSQPSCEVGIIRCSGRKGGIWV